MVLPPFLVCWYWFPNYFESFEGNANQNLLSSSHLVSAQCWAEGKVWPILRRLLWWAASWQCLLFSFPVFLPRCLSSKEALSGGRSKLEEALGQLGSRHWLHIINIWGALKNMTVCSLLPPPPHPTPPHPTPPHPWGLEFNWLKVGPALIRF